MTCDSCDRPTAGAKLCDDCQETFRYALAKIPVYYDELDNIARKQTRFSDQPATKGSIGKVQPLPIDHRFAGANEAGTQLRYDTAATVTAWAKQVMEALPPPLAATACPDACLHTVCAAVRRTAWPTETVASMAGYLARQFPHIVRAEWGSDMFDEFHDIEKRLKRMVDRPADRWYAGRCLVLTGPDLEPCQRELYAREDRGWIDCQGCGIRHDVHERREKLLAEAEDQHVTASQAARALMAWTDYDGNETRLVDRINRWRNRELLEVADVTSLRGRDRHQYRLGDITALLIRDARNTQGKTLAS